jgi:hypothetical protein
MRSSILLFAGIFFIFPHTQAQDNRLTKKEKRAGWTLLFDGKTTNGWHGYNKDRMLRCWDVQDGSIHQDPSVKDDRGDLVTDGVYDDFELRFNWKVAPKGNSGMIFMIQELPRIYASWFSGPEYQMMDNFGYPSKLEPDQYSGSLFDLVGCPLEICKPAGQWNESTISVDHGRIRLGLNGTQTVDITMGSADWTKAVAGSKFANMADFAKVQSGRIAIQEHGGEVWVKNIRIRKL